MPTVTHALIGALLGFLLYLQSNSEKNGNHKIFSRIHVIIFALNAFIGPDLAKIGLTIGPISESEIIVIINNSIHNILGWVVFSIPLSFLYFFIFSKFSIPKKGEEQIKITTILKLIIGAGLLHFGMDMLDNNVRIFPNFSIFPDLILSVEGFKTGEYFPAIGPLSGLFPWFSMFEFFLIGLFFLVLIIWLFFNKSLKSVILVSFIFVVVVLSIILLFGTNTTNQENDFGFFFYLLIFWIIPIALCLWSYELPKVTE